MDAQPTATAHETVADMARRLYKPVGLLIGRAYASRMAELIEDSGKQVIVYDPTRRLESVGGSYTEAEKIARAVYNRFPTDYFFWDALVALSGGAFRALTRLHLGEQSFVSQEVGGLTYSVREALYQDCLGKQMQAMLVVAGGDTALVVTDCGEQRVVGVLYGTAICHLPYSLR